MNDESKTQPEVPAVPTRTPALIALEDKFCEHCGYIAEGHYSDDAMMAAVRDEDGDPAGENAYRPPIRGYGRWEDSPSMDTLHLVWSDEPKEVYNPMTWVKCDVD